MRTVSRYILINLIGRNTGMAFVQYAELVELASPVLILGRIQDTIKIAKRIAIRFATFYLKISHGGTTNPVTRICHILSISNPKSRADGRADIQGDNNRATKELEAAGNTATVAYNCGCSRSIGAIGKKENRTLFSLNRTATKSIIRPLARSECDAIPSETKIRDGVSCNRLRRLVTIRSAQTLSAATTTRGYLREIREGGIGCHDITANQEIVLDC